MFRFIRSFRCHVAWAALAAILTGAGCQSLSHGVPAGAVSEATLPHGPMPCELSKVSLPPYVIEPPDILVIEGLHIVPRPEYGLRTGDVISIRAQETVSDSPYRLRKGDVLAIDAYETVGDTDYRMRKGDFLLLQVQGTLPGAPITGPATVESDGTVNLDSIRFAAPAGSAEQAPNGGVSLDTLYGSVPIAGRNREEVQAAITAHLQAKLRQPVVAVFILKKAPPQGFASEFLVEADGTVNLDARLGTQVPGTFDAAGRPLDAAPRYGVLQLAGRTREEACRAIEEHLGAALPKPRVTVSVLRMAAPERIAGAFRVEPEGTVNLDAPLNAQAEALAAVSGVSAGEEQLLNSVTRYGSVAVAGRTREQAQRLIAEQLQEALPQPQVAVSVLQMVGLQQIAGQHLVTPDGTVTLGTFGSVPVVGQTLAEAKWAIESHLARDLEQPEVAVDVFAYNSKVYYVVFQGAGTGDAVYRFPITGNETVLDAMTGIGGFEYVSSQRMWIARPTPDGGNVQILPVDWEAITAQGAVATNYQLMPGDRVFIAEDKMIALDTGLAKMLAPVERVMGFSMLGAQTVSRFSGNVLSGGGLRGFFGGQ